MKCRLSKRDTVLSVQEQPTAPLVGKRYATIRIRRFMGMALNVIRIAESRILMHVKLQASKFDRHDIAVNGRKTILSLNTLLSDWEASSIRGARRAWLRALSSLFDKAERFAGDAE